MAKRLQLDGPSLTARSFVVSSFREGVKTQGPRPSALKEGLAFARVTIVPYAREIEMSPVAIKLKKKRINYFSLTRVRDNGDRREPRPGARRP